MKRQYLSSKFVGPLSLGLLCFQGFGIRIFDGVIPGAIAIWSVLLFVLNYKYIIKIKYKYWIYFLLLVLAYLIFNYLKGIKPAFFLIVAWISGIFAISRYVKYRKQFIVDFAKLCRFCMYYSIVHIPVFIIFHHFLIHTNLDMEPETIMGLFWYNRDEGLFGLPRIQGFAWEPSCWNLLLNLNLAFVLHYKRPLKEIILAVFAIVSIMSTTGLMTMIAILGLNWLLNLKVKYLLRSLFIGLIPLLLVSPFVLNEFEEKMATSSGNTRLGDIYVASTVILMNPLFGADLDHITDNGEAMLARQLAWNQDYGISQGYMENGMVNSFAALFVEWGSPLTILILLCFIMNRLVLDWRLNFLIVTTVFLVIIGTPITRTGFFYMFVLSSFMLPKYKDKKDEILRLLRKIAVRKKKTIQLESIEVK